MKGTSLPATVAMRRIPPRSTRATSTAMTTPTTQGGTLKVSCRTWATELAWTVLPIPNPARNPNTAKAPPSQAHLRPSPFLM